MSHYKVSGDLAKQVAARMNKKADDPTEPRIANRKTAQGGPSTEKLKQELLFALNDAMETAYEVSRGEWLVTDDATGEEHYVYYDPKTQTLSVQDGGGEGGWDYKVDINLTLTPAGV